MSSIFRLSDNLVPLFIGVLAIILSIEAAVPGRLEEHSQLPWFFIDIFLVLPINAICMSLNIPLIPPTILLNLFLIFPFVLFAGYDIYQIVFGDRSKSHPLQLSGVFSFLITAIAILSIYFGIPAKLCFYAHQDRFQQVLAEVEYKKIKKVGLLEIQDIFVVNSDSLGERLPQRDNNSDKDIYFVTVDGGGWSNRFSCGFVYLPSNLKTISNQENSFSDFRYSFNHIYGKWYIFSETRNRPDN